jgi:hypothetical protein
MIKCEECGKEMNMITNTHLRTHSLTPAAYRMRYNTPLCSPEMLQHITETRGIAPELPFCANPKLPPHKTRGPKNIYCSPKCSMSHRMAKDGRNEQVGHKLRKKKEVA